MHIKPLANYNKAFQKWSDKEQMRVDDNTWRGGGKVGEGKNTQETRIHRGREDTFTDIKVNNERKQSPRDFAVDD